MKAFIEHIKPCDSDKILDIGGVPNTWTSQPQTVRQIDCLNIYSPKWNPKEFPDHRIRNITGDGCSLEFEDDSYEILFSNSVIEHVGDWDKQQSFAHEARRVGKKLWIQTPAFECPIEPHYLAPFVHWLPRAARERILRWFTPWGLIQKPSKEYINRVVDETQLLTVKQFRQLFPDCKIHTERMLWVIPKSYIAIRT